MEDLAKKFDGFDAIMTKVLDKLTGLDVWKASEEASMDTTTNRAICPGSKGLFVPVLEPGQGRRDKSAGGFCPGW